MRPAELKEQKKVFGIQAGQMFFTRQPWEAALLSVLAGLPFKLAYCLWLVLGASAILAAVALWPGLPRTSAYCLLAAYAPAVFAVSNGQDVPFVLLIMAGSAALSNGGLPFAAGLVLALGQMKFHLLLPAALMLVVGRQWRVLAGGATGTAVLALASTAVAGWNWPVRYAAAIFRRYEGQEAMPTVFHVLRAVPGGVLLWWLLVIAAGWAVWRVGRKGSVADMLTVSPALVIPLVSHVFAADATVVFPLLLLTLLHAKHLPLRVATLALMTPIIWLLALGGYPWTAVVAALILGLGLAFAATLRDAEA